MNTIVNLYRHTIYSKYSTHYFYNIVLYPLHFSIHRRFITTTKHYKLYKFSQAHQGKHARVLTCSESASAARYHQALTDQFPWSRCRGAQQVPMATTRRHREPELRNPLRPRAQQRSATSEYSPLRDSSRPRTQQRPAISIPRSRDTSGSGSALWEPPHYSQTHSPEKSPVRA